MVSVQATTLNGFMKTVIKPLASKMPVNNRVKKLARPVFDTVSAFLPIPHKMSVERVDVGGVRAEWVESGTTQPDRVLLYFHGGGYFFGSPRSHRALTCRLSRVGKMRVLAIDYRQNPKHIFPAPIEDGVTAFQWLLDQGYQPENIVFGGDSAGGNLTLASMMKLKQLGLPMPGGALCISPWADLSSTGESMRYNETHDPMIPPGLLVRVTRHYVGDNDPFDPLISPAFGDFSGFPPMLLHVGSTEVLLDSAKTVANKAEEAGVTIHYREWEKMFHVFHFLAGVVPEAT